MTERQRKCFDFIADYIAARGIAPTYDEIGKAIGSRSRGGIHDLVHRLVDQGLLTKTKGGSRNLRLVGVDLSRVPSDELRAELERRG